MVNQKSRRSKQSRRSKSQRRSQKQRGGACAAYPLNRQSFQLSRRNQRGGMAPFNYDNALLLDQPTRVQAEVAGLDRYIADSQVLAKQAGGSWYMTKRGTRHVVKKSKGRKGRKSQRSKSQRSKSQRGGNHLAAFDGSYELLSAGNRVGQNPQFHSEHQVRDSYHENKGAQY